MDKLENYRQIIQEVLKPYVIISYANAQIQNQTVFDLASERYLIVSVGWSKEGRIHGCLIHIEIIDSKVWVQRDGTEYGVTNELLEAGILTDIVLGFYEPEVRPHTGFAVA